MLKIAIITVSDRAYKGEYKDLCGPLIKEIIRDSKIDTAPSLTVVPDEGEEIKAAIMNKLDCDYIITTGGTGISPRDITPDITRDICDREIPGICEWLRAQSLKQTPFAVFSRGFAGVKNKTIIINFPGSVNGARFYIKLVLPILKHGKEMLSGKSH